MTENEIFSQFSEFGYYVLKTGQHTYHVFDRRSGQRIRECRSFETLISLADEVFLFSFMSEILEKTVSEFKRIYDLIEEADKKPSEEVKAFRKPF